MVEMLGVLAIIGVLVIVGIFLMRFAMDKLKANNLLQEVHLIYASHFSKQNIRHNVWEAYPHKTISPYFFFVLFDDDNDLYIRADGVEKGVCNRALDMQSDGELTILTTDNYLFKECTDSNDMVFALNALSFIGHPCEINTDCGKNFNGYCDTKRQVCIGCTEREILNDFKTACLLVCLENETLCTNESDDKWCCKNTQLCGTQKNTCQESTGQCIYNFVPISTDNKYYSDCAYTYSMPSTDNNYYSDCAYTYSIPSAEAKYKTDCAMLFTTSGDTVVFNEITPCTDPNQYCSVWWTQSEWALTENPVISNSSTGTLYGRCSDMDVNSVTGLLSADNHPTVTETKGCTNPNQYCSVWWTQSEWALTENPVISDSSTGTLYGRCSDMDVNSVTGLLSADNHPTVTEVKGCTDPNQYCSVWWTQSEWALTENPVISDSSTGTLYGRCSDMDINSVTGLLSGDSGNIQYTVELPCPKAYYCSLKWTDATCNSPISDASSGRIYGRCDELDAHQNICPIEK